MSQDLKIIAECDAGLLVILPLRNAVEYMQEIGFNITIWVGKGWLSKPVVIKGDEAARLRITPWLMELAKD